MTEQLVALSVLDHFSLRAPASWATAAGSGTNPITLRTEEGSIVTLEAMASSVAHPVEVLLHILAGAPIVALRTLVHESTGAEAAALVTSVGGRTRNTVLVAGASVSALCSIVTGTPPLSRELERFRESIASIEFGFAAPEGLGEGVVAALKKRWPALLFTPRGLARIEAVDPRRLDRYWQIGLADLARRVAVEPARAEERILGLLRVRPVARATIPARKPTLSVEPMTPVRATVRATVEHGPSRVPGEAK